MNVFVHNQPRQYDLEGTIIEVKQFTEKQNKQNIPSQKEQATTYRIPVSVTYIVPELLNLREDNTHPRVGCP